MAIIRVSDCCNAPVKAGGICSKCFNQLGSGSRYWWHHIDTDTGRSDKSDSKHYEEPDK